jgi:hypothetical protein
MTAIWTIEYVGAGLVEGVGKTLFSSPLPRIDEDICIPDVGRFRVVHVEYRCKRDELGFIAGMVVIVESVDA